MDKKNHCNTSYRIVSRSFHIKPSYYVTSQPNQTQNNLPTPTPSPSETPTEPSTPKPSVPEFTLKFVDASYDVPTTYSIDPYTGENVTHQEYHVENRSIQVSIKNQPFASYESGGQIINFYINIRTKGHYDDKWKTIYSPSKDFLIQSNYDYTTVAYTLDMDEFPFFNNIQEGGKVDFQVQALIGSIHRTFNVNATNIMNIAPWIFEGQTSDWSNTQTIKIP
jgi:hypothetical protein